MKILVVEDNERLAERIKQQLGRHYIVDAVHTGVEAIERLAEIEYGVIVLDLGLPDISGLRLCKMIREKEITAPILILTGEDDMDMRVELLDSGADDYLTKPFHYEELRARITALGRRRPIAQHSSLIVHHDLVIDTVSRQVYREGTHIPLRRKEFDILEYLVTHKGRVLTREMIINHAWDSGKVSWTTTVDVHIKHLRDKIDRPFKTPLIKTSYGLGYRVDIPERIKKRKVKTT